MISLSDIGEILFKPSLEAIGRDITNWSETLMRVSDASSELGFSADETELLTLRMRQRLATSIAGTLSPRHRDRPSLDEVSQQFKVLADKMVEESGGSMRYALVDRAANMISTAYVSEDEGSGNDGLNKIKMAVQRVKETS